MMNIARGLQNTQQSNINAFNLDLDSKKHLEISVYASIFGEFINCQVLIFRNVF